MTSQLGSNERPLRVAVVGSGPSGYYAAEALINDTRRVAVDMFESLPAPFGLVRYGVAPDHGKIKNIISRYIKTAESDDYAFLGNVNVGVDISVAELSRFYDAIVFASGAQTDRRLGIPGEDLPGSYTATEFVAWYNGHPHYRGSAFDLSHETAVVIGQGNVAVDVARILAKTIDELKTTDIAEHALAELAESKVRNIHMIGRRGPVQAAFSAPEIKELGLLEDCTPVVAPEAFELNAASMEELEVLKWRDAQKKLKIMEGFIGLDRGSKSKSLHIEFLRGPVELVGDGKVEGVVLEKNALSGEAGRQKAAGTGARVALPCGAFFRSVGYRGVALPGVPFDDGRGVIPNEEGRVVEQGRRVPGLYAVGWIKRGPSGIIGTNKPDSFETVGHLLSDVESMKGCDEPERGAVLTLLKERNVRVVTYSDWLKIDAAEVDRGAAVGKPREKFVTVEEMLNAAGL